MRLIAMLCGVLLLGAACQSGPKKAPFESQTTPVPGPAAQKSSGPARKAGPETVVPINPIIGKVVSVNPSLRFVVVDFMTGPLPEQNQKLNVYRNGQKVAEARFSGPFRNSNVAADILAGEVQVGDEVRQN
jgi:hypothetical protein